MSTATISYPKVEKFHENQIGRYFQFKVDLHKAMEARNLLRIVEKDASSKKPKMDEALELKKINANNGIINPATGHPFEFTLEDSKIYSYFNRDIDKWNEKCAETMQLLENSLSKEIWNAIEEEYDFQPLKIKTEKDCWSVMEYLRRTFGMYSQSRDDRNRRACELIPSFTTVTAVKTGLTQYKTLMLERDSWNIINAAGRTIEDHSMSDTSKILWILRRLDTSLLKQNIYTILSR